MGACDFFNLDPPFGRRHKDDATGRAIHHSAQIQFFGNVSAAFNENGVDGLAFGISLIGD
jgi:hypothetical protein